VIVRIRAGVYATLDADRHVVVAAEHGGMLTCTYALRSYGIWVLQHPPAIHVWLGGNGRVHHRECTCVSHFVAGRAALGVVALEDALVHVHRCAGDELFFAALESALAQRKINRAARERIRRGCRTMRSGWSTSPGRMLPAGSNPCCGCVSICAASISNARSRSPRWEGWTS